MAPVRWGVSFGGKTSRDRSGLNQSGPGGRPVGMFHSFCPSLTQVGAARICRVGKASIARAILLMLPSTRMNKISQHTDFMRKNVMEHAPNEKETRFRKFSDIRSRLASPPLAPCLRKDPVLAQKTHFSAAGIGNHWIGEASSHTIVADCEKMAHRPFPAPENRVEDRLMGTEEQFGKRALPG